MSSVRHDPGAGVGRDLLAAARRALRSATGASGRRAARPCRAGRRRPCSESPMLLRASPRKQYAIWLIGLSLCSVIVSTSARIWVGWNSSVSPFHTGTPAYLPRSSTTSWCEAPVLDPVVHPAEDARGVLHRFLVADLRAIGPEVRDVGALVVGGDLERRARAGRGLLEDDRDVLALQARLLIPAVLRVLEVRGHVEEEADLGRGEIQQGQEVPVAQVEPHGW